MRMRLPARLKAFEMSPPDWNDSIWKGLPGEFGGEDVGRPSPSNVYCVEDEEPALWYFCHASRMTRTATTTAAIHMTVMPDVPRKPMKPASSACQDEP